VIRVSTTLAAAPGYCVSTETIGGSFLLEVDSIEEAVEIARQCPALDYGLQVEVRPVAPQCMVKERAEEKAGVPELATA